MKLWVKNGFNYINKITFNMQGPGTEKEAKIGFLLALCILFTLIAAGLVSCCDKKSKHTSQPVVSQYQNGDIVYLKPDSTIGVIGDVTNYVNGIVYRIGYKNNQGIIEYHDFTETQIYNKKQ